MPNPEDTFLLMPLDRVRWRGVGQSHHITVRFDGRGHPTDYGEFALSLTASVNQAA